VTTFSGPEGVAAYQAIVIKHAIKFYAKTGMKVNRAYTPTNMLRVASKITGHPYKRGQFDQAVADLELWIANNKGL
jgi:hypothetical protein